MNNITQCLADIKEHMQTWMVPDEIESNWNIIKQRAQATKDGESSKPYIGYTVHKNTLEDCTYTFEEIPELTSTHEEPQTENKYYDSGSTNTYTMTLYGTQLPHTISTNEIKLISYAQAVAYIAGMLYSQLPSHMDKDEKRAAADSIVLDILADHNKIFQSQNKVLFCVEDDLYIAKSLACFRLLDPYDVVTKHPHILPILCNDLQYCTVLTYKDCL